MYIYLYIEMQLLPFILDLEMPLIIKPPGCPFQFSSGFLLGPCVMSHDLLQAPPQTRDLETSRKETARDLEHPPRAQTGCLAAT